MKTLTLVFSILLFSNSARGDNCSGKWVLETAGPRGHEQRIVLILNQTGETLTGTISGRNNPAMASPVNTEIYGGKVEGGTVSFYIWLGNDQPWKRHFKGKLSGDEIVFTITSDGPPSSQQYDPDQSTSTTNATARRSQ